VIDVSSFIENIHATYQCVKFVGRSMEEMFSGGGFEVDDFDAFADDIHDPQYDSDGSDMD